MPRRGLGVASVVDADVYRVKIRFEKLFADPRVFDEPETLARRYFLSSGVTAEKAAFIYQTTQDLAPLDDAGKPSVPAGVAKYTYQGKTLRSEYMQGANLVIDYVDFGSGLPPPDHMRIWRAGRWDDLKFETKDVHHYGAKTGLPEVLELYRMLRARADPSTLATVELPDMGKSLFESSVKYLEDRLKQKSQIDGGSVEIYAARDLAPEERQALERRLVRDSTDSTVYVILSREPAKPKI